MNWIALPLYILLAVPIIYLVCIVVAVHDGEWGAAVIFGIGAVVVSFLLGLGFAALRSA